MWGSGYTNSLELHSPKVGLEIKKLHNSLTCLMKTNYQCLNIVHVLVKCIKTFPNCDNNIHDFLYDIFLISSSFIKLNYDMFHLQSI